MLKIDRQQTIEGVTVYGDDERPQLFYLLPSNLSFRIDDNGKPVFKFVKYRFPIDREDGRKGGGFVFFDVALEVPAAKEQKIRQQLQAGLDALYQSQPLPPLLAPLLGGWGGRGGQTPPVELGSITFTRGTCDFLLSDTSGALIQKVTGAGKPSLYGKNVAAFAMELTPEGATLFEQTMQGQGVGGVAVAYDLWMWARMPAIEGRAWFHGHEFYAFTQSITIDYSLCGDDEYVESIREQAYSSETMGVELNPGFAIPGDAEGTRKIVDSVRSSLQKGLETAVARKALKPIDPVAADKRELPEGDFEKVTRDFSTTKDVHYEQTYSETSVIEWNVAPRGNVPNITSMAGPDGKPFLWKDYAIEVDLNDPFFRQINVTLGVNADFAALPIHSVEVHLEYKSGATHQIGEYAFTDPAKVERFASYTEGDVQDYEWWYEVNYKGEAQTFKSEPKRTDERVLTVNVDDLGILHVDVEAGDIDFAQVGSVQIAFEYEAASGKVERQFTLTKDARASGVKEVIFEPRLRPYRWKPKFFMVDGTEQEGEWSDGFSDKVFVNDPFGVTKTVALRAAGDLVGEIDQIFLDLKYADGAFERTTSVALSATTPFFDWRFSVPGEGKGTVTYSGQIRRKNGTIEPIEPTTAESMTILVGEILADRMTVAVVPSLLDFATVKLARVALRYSDPAKPQAKDFLFSAADPAPKDWDVELTDPAKRDYTWQATYFGHNGDQVTMDPVSSTEPTVILQPPALTPANPAPVPIGQPAPAPTPPAPVPTPVAPAPVAPAPAPAPAPDPFTPAGPPPAGPQG